MSFAEMTLAQVSQNRYIGPWARHSLGNTMQVRVGTGYVCVWGGGRGGRKTPSLGPRGLTHLTSIKADRICPYKLGTRGDAPADTDASATLTISGLAGVMRNIRRMVLVMHKQAFPGKRNQVSSFADHAPLSGSDFEFDGDRIDNHIALESC